MTGNHLQVGVVDLLVGHRRSVAMTWSDNGVGRKGHHFGFDAIDENRVGTTKQVGAPNATLEHHIPSENH